MLDHVRTLQKINIHCEELLSDIKDYLICYMMDVEYFYPFPRMEPEVRAVVI